MRILLDDTPCDLKAKTVGEAIDAAAEVARRLGRLIIEVTVDDTLWAEVELSSPTHLEASAEVVRLTSAEPRKLVNEAFADAADALADADELQKEAARLVQSDQYKVSMDKLNEALSIWLSVQEAIVKGSRIVGIDLDDVIVGERSINASISRLNEWLLVIRDALTDSDQIALADTLLYELPEVVGEWQSILVYLQHLAREGGR